MYLPTSSLALLDALHSVRPSHTLIAADFDALPDVQVPGINAPLVSSRTSQGQAQDHDTVFVPWGSADIFFPTDFDVLATLYKQSAMHVAQMQQPCITPALQQARCEVGSSSTPAAAPAVGSRGTVVNIPQGGNSHSSSSNAHSSSSTEGSSTCVAEAATSSAPHVDGVHMSTSSFMSGFPETKATCTLSGYSPLLQGWPNTRIFVGNSQPSAGSTQ